MKNQRKKCISKSPTTKVICQIDSKQTTESGRKLRSHAKMLAPQVKNRTTISRTCKKVAQTGPRQISALPPRNPLVSMRNKKVNSQIDSKQTMKSGRVLTLRSHAKTLAPQVKNRMTISRTCKKDGPKVAQTGPRQISALPPRKSLVSMRQLHVNSQINSKQTMKSGRLLRSHAKTLAPQLKNRTTIQRTCKKDGPKVAQTGPRQISALPPRKSLVSMRQLHVNSQINSKQTMKSGRVLTLRSHAKTLAPQVKNITTISRTCKKDGPKVARTGPRRIGALQNSQINSKQTMKSGRVLRSHAKTLAPQVKNRATISRTCKKDGPKVARTGPRQISALPQRKPIVSKRNEKVNGQVKCKQIIKNGRKRKSSAETSSQPIQFIRVGPRRISAFPQPQPIMVKNHSNEDDEIEFKPFIEDLQKLRSNAIPTPQVKYVRIRPRRISALPPRETPLIFTRYFPVDDEIELKPIIENGRILKDNVIMHVPQINFVRVGPRRINAPPQYQPNMLMRHSHVDEEIEIKPIVENGRILKDNVIMHVPQIKYVRVGPRRISAQPPKEPLVLTIDSDEQEPPASVESVEAVEKQVVEPVEAVEKPVVEPVEAVEKPVVEPRRITALKDIPKE